MELPSALVEDLVTRAERIRFYVGDTLENPEQDARDGSENAVHRLQAVQRAVSDICARHPAAQALLDLRELSNVLPLPVVDATKAKATRSSFPKMAPLPSTWQSSLRC